MQHNGIALKRILGVFMRQKNRPEQLHLDFEWNYYLDQLQAAGEHLDVYEESAMSLYRIQPFLGQKSPIMEEIVLHGHK